MSSATALRRTAGYETRTFGGGGGWGRESPSCPISGGRSSTTAAIATAIPSRSSRPPSRNPWNSTELILIVYLRSTRVHGSRSSQPAIQSSALIRT